MSADPKIEIITDPEEVANQHAEAALCRGIGEILLKHYPKRNWHVDVSVAGGVAKIYLPAVSNQYHYIIHLDNVVSVEDMRRKVVRVGGEILERFKLSRERNACNDILDLKINALTGEALGAERGEALS